ncbi:hypothetical protein MP228_005507 [Amoeboaphelidium protococcarum]|nr:hypothetical protein MP228_005507 [Amoeboaphelidium protococcarum]
MFKKKKEVVAGQSFSTLPQSPSTQGGYMAGGQQNSYNMVGNQHPALALAQMSANQQYAGQQQQMQNYTNPGGYGVNAMAGLPLQQQQQQMMMMQQGSPAVPRQTPQGYGQGAALQNPMAQQNQMQQQQMLQPQQGAAMYSYQPQQQNVAQNQQNPMAMGQVAGNNYGSMQAGQRPQQQQQQQQFPPQMQMQQQMQQPQMLQQQQMQKQQQQMQYQQQQQQNFQPHGPPCLKCSKACDQRNGFIGLKDGSNFHKECFTCGLCDQVLPLKFVHKRKKYFHTDCYDHIKATLPACAHCKIQLLPMEPTLQLPTGSTYHEECFVCDQCTKPLGQIVLPFGELLFHQECMGCFNCNRSLAGVQYDQLPEGYYACINCLSSIWPELYATSNPISKIATPLNQSNNTLPQLQGSQSSLPSGQNSVRVNTQTRSLSNTQTFGSVRASLSSPNTQVESVTPQNFQDYGDYSQTLPSKMAKMHLQGVQSGGTNSPSGQALNKPPSINHLQQAFGVPSQQSIPDIKSLPPPISTPSKSNTPRQSVAINNLPSPAQIPPLGNLPTQLPPPASLPNGLPPPPSLPKNKPQLPSTLPILPERSHSLTDSMRAQLPLPLQQSSASSLPVPPPPPSSQQSTASAPPSVVHSNTEPLPESKGDLLSQIRKASVQNLKKVDNVVGNGAISAQGKGVAAGAGGKVSASAFGKSGLQSALAQSLNKMKAKVAVEEEDDGPEEAVINISSHLNNRRKHIEEGGNEAEDDWD